ncbi:hypothetical protein A3I95_00635 [Candidatus Nomurabacteria bacterium RIFCSPLOWO2_02_FULL_44_12]|uniref:TrbC/VIRB2 family protein n=1 Tax=Candidatus Nomurabacteria bacterium RIFCSPLOWO2_12_FULL_44_11 TaxID=1801796 RepID=A0A1F6Y7X8_9BACT|nr:MAG: hypothetical protein A3E95_01750 [Candidatus Nomurabacteria bacterium RIFCSPHIGHO2_12_FULL_44_22b]OGJ02477.1 MAG: hypothetical protein A3G53_01105 [Candidatus Nomurabacteria bacterium RIFCSPLOWO2_12_FULL_44_11]OGJ07312.1 MAG: hypothetical protein A3I95_00635 [Candidatus Nomurabacteria bacterium RIFCSPLOWO2_02_FULL_44_12]
MTKFLISIFIFFLLISPALSLAQGNEGTGLIPCGTLVDASGKVTNSCGFGDFMKLINWVIDFILKKLALPIAAIMFVYAGFLMVTGGGSTEAAGKARKIFTSTALGLILAAAAWVIVKAFLSIMGYKEVGLFFMK